MILSRYFAKEVYSTVFAVTLVLVLVFLVNQTIRFLSQAASGHLASSAVLNLILLELPYLLGLLLPLGLFLGILITYSRFYADQEMTVLFAAGMSHWQLFRITLGISSVIFVLVCGLMFGLNPFLAKKKNDLLTTTTIKNLVAALVPGTFKISQNGQRVIYVGSVSRNHKIAENLFIAEAPIADKARVQTKEKLKSESRINWTITAAQSGYQKRDPNNNQLFMIAKNGYRYQGSPGEKEFEVTKYKQYGVELPEEETFVSQDRDALSSWQLILNTENQLRYKVELQWRMALPISVILLAIVAQLLSHVAPRQGRFQKLMPALLIYIVYANMIFVGKSWMSHGQTPSYLGLWWIHALMLAFIFLLVLTQKRAR